MSNKKKTTSKSNETATVAPSSYSTPYINDAAAQLKPAFEAATQNNASLMPRINDALDYYSDTLAGGKLTGNPYLDAIVQRSNRDITTGVDSRFSSAGRYGSGMHAGVLARALADNENQLRYQDYSQERAYQDAAARGVLSSSTISAGLPQAAAGTYADQVNALLGRYTTGTSKGTSTTTESGGLLGQLIAAGAQVGAAYASDRRLKREIERIGELADGLAVYVWRYLWGEPGVGVMADEVAEKRPWALGPKLHGFATVNYGAL